MKWRINGSAISSHGVVGRYLAQRGLSRVLDGDEGCRTQFYPAMAKLAERLRGEAVRHGADARRTSHPIQQPIANETEAMIAFDAITYNKGQALIRMMEKFGEAGFRTLHLCGRACLWQHHHGRYSGGR